MHIAALGVVLLLLLDGFLTLFSRVTLLSKVHLTSDLHYFHVRDLPCSRVKSHDDQRLSSR